jgi:rubrerythrin
VELFLLGYKKERQKKNQEFISSSKWRKASAKILKYDNFNCQICGYEANSLRGQKNLRYKLKVHHIILDSADEDLTPKNLVTLCTRCHNLLHGPHPTRILLLKSAGIYRDSFHKPLQSISGIGRVDVEGLRNFYHMVKKASESNKKRFKAPLENLMTQICYICPHINECSFGEIMLCLVEYGYFEQFESYAKKGVVSIGKISPEIRSSLDVEGYVTEKSESIEVDTKYGKTKLAKAVLKDDTGEILLNLWGNQIQMVEIGDLIRVEDAYIQVYDGKTTLNIPKRGKILVLLPSKSK